jgi:hypothetical protein
MVLRVQGENAGRAHHNVIDVSIVLTDWHTMQHSPRGVELAKLKRHLFFALGTTSPGPFFVVCPK